MISVIVPVYNEANSIREFLERLDGAVDDFEGHEIEIIVVSDGSTDDSVGIAAETGLPNLHVYSYPQNRGKGFALKHGYEKSIGEVVVFCDGDLDIDPTSIRPLVRLLDLQNADVVVASKTHKESVVTYPMFRKLQSSIFKLIIMALFRLNVRDTQTGLKVFRRNALESSIRSTQEEGFAFDLELLAILSRDYRIVEGPVHLTYRFSSTVGFRTPIRMLGSTIRIWRRLRHRDK